MASPVGTRPRMPHRTLLLAGIGSITGVLLLTTGLMALQVAIAMAERAQRRSRRPEILALAGRIRAAQSQEIDQMRLWLQQWYPAAAAPSLVPPMGLESLRNAADFDRVFLEQMVAHHRMGVRMAAMAQIHTRRLVLVELEQQMVRNQSQEIEQMLQWYARWYGGPKA